ncbi:DEAD/DEAH box helicase [Vibrio parahaemolyticus]|uniref:DEAD/DEAH box helicase n=2 Tax=Vibrio harveyi group TaxID=717610 RepID=UPI0011249AAA|nr:DEAD/DEAH box helicase [Vibrio parahaemolyticus]TOK89451.1 hypothetical protein CGI10_04435 [Vibrio parahaemolyticus]
MASANYYKNIVGQLSRRSVEATVGIWGVINPELRRHLINEFGTDPERSNFLADPVFESLFAWEPDPKNTMQDLAGSLLQPSLIKAMDKAEGHRFGKDWSPFKHQVKSWKYLLKEHKSIVVTSGTGSGKTECFMVPILNDLALEYETTGSPLEGVRALFLYPLNALINSQRERLRAWTSDYEKGVRFSLYNGNTEENKHPEQDKYPNEVLTRKVLRDSPPPILVTNATMLEYMLVRQIDEPIIEKSKGNLRWIVLDEAHTYVGSQAAELSLLLRRVMHTFCVEAQNVRFVATSATIGDKDSNEKLKRYLADLAGIEVSQVEVVGGKRVMPPIKEEPQDHLPIDSIASIEQENTYSTKRYEALAKHHLARQLRDFMSPKSGAKKLSDISNVLFGDPNKIKSTLAWLDLCSYTVQPGNNPKKPNENAIPFLPLRAHLFQKVVNGLWCCVDPNCKCKQGTPLEKNWPFGKVYTEWRNNCDCGAPLYELVFCNDCSSPHLLAVQSDNRLLQDKLQGMDEFSLNQESSEEIEIESYESDVSSTWILSPQETDGSFTIELGKDRELSSGAMDSYMVNILELDSPSCWNCENSSNQIRFYRRTLIGAPFYISNAMPVLLDASESRDEATYLPYHGKRLITFTDSRQGTARIAVKIQQDAERDCIRSLIYEKCMANVVTLDVSDVEEKELALRKAEDNEKKARSFGADEIAQDYADKVEQLKKELAETTSIKPLSWQASITGVSENRDIKKWMYFYYRNLNQLLFNESVGYRTLAELLLVREFARRPKRKNSLESLGMVSVTYPTLELITKEPDCWKQLNLDLIAWKDFLKITLDFYVRQNFAMDVPKEWIKWLGEKLSPRSLVRYDAEEKSVGPIRRWPQVNKTNPNNQNRLIKLLLLKCNLSLDNERHVDLINDCLKAGWDALTKTYPFTDPQTGHPENRRILRPTESSRDFQLARQEMAFKPITKAWVCSQTHRLLDTTFCGLTPYVPRNAILSDVECKEVILPLHHVDASQYATDSDRKQAIRQWLDNQEAINYLRSENLWTDISDRIVEGNRFFRAAEHSAQQSSEKLEKYEQEFKDGELNVLSCSTTMEMGVDIGGISVVANNNVPPHPANYLQRAGRAGRRSETQALAFTMCKDNPHEQGVYQEPLWPFLAKVAAPTISLNSERIILRHVNALLLAWFLKKEMKVVEQNILTLSCSWFFAGSDGSPIKSMSRWLESMAISVMPDDLYTGVKSLIAGSVLAGRNNEWLLKKSVEALNSAKNSWLPSYLKLKEEEGRLSRVSERDPYRKKLQYDIKCMEKEYLLSALATNSYLPGYGFPTGVVTFDHYSVSDFKKGKYLKDNGRIDNNARLRNRPARDLPVAIREYAPGSEIVIDGLVHCSKGVLLNKFSPNEDFSDPIKMQIEWRCHHCGTIWNESGSTYSGQCHNCGSNILDENTKEFLTPEGFAIEFYSEPSVDVTTRSYIPVSEPWVNANGEIKLLFEPRLGAFQSSSKGLIFHHSSGLHSAGYAVCLRCGRAESMLSKDEFPVELKPGKAHYRLQGRPDKESSNACEGSTEAYAIKGNVHLGSTNQTDMFELYLKRPTENAYLHHKSGDKLVWTLAVALRQALADIHGIKADELGYTVKPATLPDCEYPVATIVLFDNAGGGAGFASSAPSHLPQIFSKAFDALKCKSNCDSACQSCLLSYDTRYHIDVLDRHVATDYLKSIQPYLSMPDEARILGDGSEYCFESLSAEFIASSSREDSKLKIFTNGNYEDWDISSCELKDSCLKWRGYFNSVELVLPSSAYASLSEINKEDLRTLKNLGVRLTEMKDYRNILSKPGSLIAQIVSNNGIMCTLASNLSGISEPSVNWWQWESGYLVKTKVPLAINTVPIPSDALTIPVIQGDVELELMHECEGNLSDFGSKLWDNISKSHQGLSNCLSEKQLIALSYSDCYVCSPWTLMLLGECIDSLRGILDEQWQVSTLVIQTSEKDANTRASWIYSEWQNTQRAEVIKEYFEQMNQVTAVRKLPIREMPHGRCLIMSWDDGSTTTIRFDHGFGCWKAKSNSRLWYDIRDASKEQVEKMYQLIPHLNVEYNKAHATQVFVKQRSG